MDRSLSLTIVSPDGILFEGKVKSVQLFGVMGSFTILPLHAPLISQLSQGKIFIEGEEKKEFVIKGGFVEVKQDIVSVCVEQ